MTGFEQAQNKLAEQATLIRELVGALKKTAAVCAGEVMNKNGLIDALESARAALSRVPAEYLERDNG